MTGIDIECLREDSTRHMMAGMRLMAQGDFPIARKEFSAACELREKLPWKEDRESAWMLAAAWINLGDALRHEVPEQAVCAYERGIEAMETLPLKEHPAFLERLVLAWINRGSVCGELGDMENAEAAFFKARALLKSDGNPHDGVSVRLNAMLGVNRSRMLLDAGNPDEAWHECRKAAEIFRRLGEASALVRACAVQCRVLAMILETPGGAERVGDWIAEATDATEEALATMKQSRIVEPWAGDLVRYGAKIYRACQPQFLGEFLMDWLAGDGPLAGDETLREEMKRELFLARAEVERMVLLAPHRTDFVEKQTAILRCLQVGEAALIGQ